MPPTLQSRKTPLLKLGQKGSGFRTKEPVQDFYEIRAQCLKEGKLFEDPQFPATNSSLYYTVYKMPRVPIRWKRPQELSRKAQLFVSGASRFDIQQGSLGDCWFLAAAANLTLHEDLFKFVVPLDQTFGSDYAGIFHFRFWQYDRWVEVVIDDRLPVGPDGKLIFLRSSQANEFWSPLLEKAYAKLYGSYEDLDGGSSGEAMVDFTGGVSEMFSLKNPPHNLSDILLSSLGHSALVSCFIMPNFEEIEAKTREGLVLGHAYSISKVCYFRVAAKEEYVLLIRIRNPWGNDFEWNGPWSDRSAEWKLVSPEEKAEANLRFASDGEFWMSFSDFQQYFSHIEICNLSSDAFVEGIYNHGSQMLQMSLCEGEWIKNFSSGSKSTYWWNPQYRITIEGNAPFYIIVALMQKNRRVQRRLGKDILAIGLHIYHLQDPEKLPNPLRENFFSKNKPVAQTEYEYLRELSLRVTLQPGTYCIIPSTSLPGEEAQFILRVFSEMKASMDELDVNITMDDIFHLAPTQMNADVAMMRKKFFEVAGKQQEVDWQGLQIILNFLEVGGLRRLKFWVQHYGLQYSKEMCRNMITIMDTDRSGKLSLEEFEVLWRAITHWKVAFTKYENASHQLEAYRLRDALGSAGYHLNNRTFSALVHRYCNSNGSINFSDFLMCAIRLTAVINIFQQMDTEQHNLVTLSLEDWVEKTAYF